MDISGSRHLVSRIEFVRNMILKSTVFFLSMNLFYVKISYVSRSSVFILFFQNQRGGARAGCENPGRNFFFPRFIRGMNCSFGCCSLVFFFFIVLQRTCHICKAREWRGSLLAPDSRRSGIFLSFWGGVGVEVVSWPIWSTGISSQVWMWYEYFYVDRMFFYIFFILSHFESINVRRKLTKKIEKILPESGIQFDLSL